jgi:hypothetical protein
MGENSSARSVMGRSEKKRPLVGEGGNGMISKCILKKLGVWTLTGFIWLRNGAMLNTILKLRTA